MTYEKKVNKYTFLVYLVFEIYFLVRPVVSTRTKSTNIHRLQHTQSPINRSGCNDKTTEENTTIIDIENISVMISNDGHITIINSDDSDSGSDTEELQESQNGDEDSSSDLDCDR